MTDFRDDATQTTSNRQTFGFAEEPGLGNKAGEYTYLEQTADESRGVKVPEGNSFRRLSINN